MAQAVVIGRVVSEPELKTSSNNNPYLLFSLAEHIGYGETARTQYYQVWAWGNIARQLKTRCVTKGSLIMVSGFLELVDYIKKDGTTKNKQLKLKLKDWDFVSTTGCRRQSTGMEAGVFSAPAENVPQIPIIDGERDTLPE